MMMKMMMMIRKQIIKISKQGKKIPGGRIRGIQLAIYKCGGQGFELGTINNKSS